MTTQAQGAVLSVSLPASASVKKVPSGMTRLVVIEFADEHDERAFLESVASARNNVPSGLGCGFLPEQLG